MGSLRAQLAVLAKSNPETARLKNLNRRDSYIYSPYQAAKLTTDQVHQIGADGFAQLLISDRNLEKFKSPLFSESSKHTDRTLLEPNDARQLQETIHEFLTCLAPYILNKPSGHVLEWLVRRFRVHEFDVPVLLSIFLPYYDTPQFLAMLNILRLDPHPHLQFLQPCKSTRLGLHPKHLIDAMLGSPELLRYVVQILPSVAKHGPVPQAFLGFHLNTFLALLRALSSKTPSHESLPQPILVALLPVLVDGVQSKQFEVRLTNLIIISLLARTYLSQEIVRNLTKYIIEAHPNANSIDDLEVENPGREEHDQAMIRTLIVLFQNCPEASHIQISKKSCHALSRIFKIEDLLLSMSEAYDISAFWKSLIRGLIKSILKNGGEVGIEEFLVKLTQLFNLPTGIVEISITEMFSALIPIESPQRSILRPLSILFQRFPNLAEQAAQDLISKSETDVKQSVSNILRLLSGDLPLNGDNSDPAVVGLTSSSATVRQSSLKAIFERMQDNSLDGPKQPGQLLTSAIKTSLNDPDPLVSQLVFSSPQAILKAVDANDILKSASSMLRTSQTPRSTLKHWISFLTGPFLLQHPEMAAYIAEEMILEKLIWTKSTAKSTTIFWALAHDKQIWQGTLLEGVWPEAMPDESAESRMKANESLLEGIGSNILKQGDSAVTSLLLKLRKDRICDNPVAKLLPLLLLWKIATRLPEFAIGILINNLIGHMTNLTDPVDLQKWVNMNTAEFETDDSISESFYSKTSSGKLFHRLYAGILIRAVSQAHKLKHPEYCWFEPGVLKAVGPVHSASVDSQPTDITNLYFMLYCLGHAGSHTNKKSLARKILVMLSRDILKQEWITFLARIWTSSTFDEAFRIVALLDAETDIRAGVTRAKKDSPGITPLDYQLLIPSLMIGLTDSSKAVRSAASSLATSLNDYSNVFDLVNKGLGASPEKSIYAYDRFYGIQASTGLQYLPIADSTKLVNLLHNSKSEIIFDGLSQVRLILENLEDSPAKPSGRKKAAEGLKHKITCFLMNVNTCWEDFEGRIGLLKCLSSVDDPVRIKLAAPLIDQMSSRSTNVVGHNFPSKDSLTEYATLLFQAYNHPGKVLISTKDSTAFDVLFRAMQCPPNTDAQLAIREAAKSKLETGLFTLLTATQKQTILRKVLTIASSSQDNVSFYVATMRSLPVDTDCFIEALSAICREVSSNNSRSTKRAKTGKDSVGQVSGDSPDITELTTLLETVSVEKLTPTFRLFAAFVNALTLLLTAFNTHGVDVHFSAQLIITHLATIVPHLEESQFKSDELQIASIVDYMRISLDPHISHKIILLLADLARLCPDLTCQSMMPIFTFVGAHVIQRDDAFSARVVDKAIQALIPPMVKSCHASGSSRIELILSLRELLLMFVGARKHIPKHRRTRLFVRLIEVLGSYNFLGAMLVLMIDANIDDLTGSSMFELPLAIWSSFPGALGVTAIAHIASEVETLLGQCSPEQPGILPLKNQEKVDDDGDQVINDGSQESNAPRVQGLLQFMSEALGSNALISKLDSARSTNKPESDEVLAYLMMQALEISQLKNEKNEIEEVSEARDIARKAAKLVSLQCFSGAVLPKLQDRDSQLVPCTLDLLRTRLPSVKASQRSDIEMCVKEAIMICTNRIQSSFTHSSVDSRVSLPEAIETLGEIAINATGSEQSLLSKAYDFLLTLAHNSDADKLTITTLSVLAQLCQLLGSRLIPQIGKTIKLCVELVERFSTFEEVTAMAFRLVETTIKTLPSFSSPHMPMILQLVATPLTPKGSSSNLAVDLNQVLDTNQTSLVRCLTKTIPLQRLQPALHSYWTGSKVSSKAALALLEILLRAIKCAKVSEVIKESKGIFNFILQIFDLRRKNVDKNLTKEHLMMIESSSSSVFLSLVLKINDETLKPLLYRLIDWATIDLPKHENLSRVSRAIALYKVFGTLLSHLQTLAVSYFTHLVDHTVTTLKEFIDGDQSDFELWTLIILTLEGTLTYDSEGFWNQARLTKITVPIINQLELGKTFDNSNQEYSSRMKSVVGKLAKKVSNHDTLLKMMNTTIVDVLKTTRNDDEDDVKVKLISLEVLEEVWKEIGPALVPFVPETVGGYLVEALEDTTGGIDQAAKKIVRRIELEIGESIEGYLA